MHGDMYHGGCDAIINQVDFRHHQLKHTKMHSDFIFIYSNLSVFLCSLQIDEQNARHKAILAMI